MKTKIRILACIMLALYVLTGASVWEGAASVSPGGDFPETGYFVATNSFPRNTIVDLTNLENDKTVRVIVAAGLEAPGLLAILSKDAAASIGFPNGVIGRIRMSQPADPIAFSRFTDGLAAEGFPASGFGDGTEFREETLTAGEDSLSRNTSSAMRVTDAAGAANAGATNATGAVNAANAAGTDSAANAAGAGVADAGSLPVPLTVLSPESEWEETSYPLAAELPEGPEYSSPGTPEDSDYTAAFGEPALITESPAPVSVLTPADGVVYDYALVPAEERPPEYVSTYTIDPDSIIPGISGNTDYVIPDAPVIYSGESVLSAEVPPPFSIPLISRLERGRYYVQVGAYSQVETVEAEVRRLGSAYPLAVFNAGSNGRPVYRILLGPLNQGESGAVLKRFKSIGYKDAFVRNGIEP